MISQLCKNYKKSIILYRANQHAFLEFLISVGYEANIIKLVDNYILLSVKWRKTDSSAAADDVLSISGIISENSIEPRCMYLSVTTYA